MATVVRRLYYEGRPGQVQSGPRQVREEWFEVGGIREGPYRKYYPSGTLCQTGSYLHGKQHGEVRAYYHKGPIYMICTLVNGLREGEHTIFYMSGQVQKRCHFKDNVQVGTYELYTPNGLPIVPDERRVVMRTTMLAGNFEPFNL